jgi:hypothetical protein
MKKIALFAMVVTTLSCFASEEVKVGVGEVEKQGFLATEACLKAGLFKDCALDTMSSALVPTQTQFALYNHDEGVIYKLDSSNFHAYELDEMVGKNNVTIIGALGKDNVIKVKGYKAPPPETKSFFKGCL